MPSAPLPLSLNTPITASIQKLRGSFEGSSKADHDAKAQAKGKKKYIIKIKNPVFEGFFSIKKEKTMGEKFCK